MISQPRSYLRRFLFTPDSLVVWLVALEAILLFSYYRWSAVGIYKGCAAVVAAVLSAAALLTLLVRLLASRALRTRFQFPLRLLLLFVPAVAFPLGLFVHQLEKARAQRETVTAIENGRSVSCYYDADAEAALERGLFTRFLRVWLGDDFFLPVIKVEVDGGSVTDAVLKRLAELRDVRLVTVNGPEAPKAYLSTSRAYRASRSLLSTKRTSGIWNCGI